MQDKVSNKVQNKTQNKTRNKERSNRQKRGSAANRMNTNMNTNTNTNTNIHQRAHVNVSTNRSAAGHFAVSVKKFEKSCKEVCAILKALSNEQRLLLLVHLLNGPKTVSELVLLCDISQSQVSQYLIRMKLEGLIESEKNGKFQTYYISDSRIVKILAAIQAEYCAC